jgi:hypothetical protein
MTSNTDPAVVEAGEALKEALELTHLEAVEKMERYHALKEAKFVTADGEILTSGELDRELTALNIELKGYIERTGEPLTREGLPDLVVQPRSTSWYRLPLMMQEDPAMLDFLMEHGLLTVKSDAKKLAATSPALMGLSKYEVRGEGTAALTFDRRPR